MTTPLPYRDPTLPIQQRVTDLLSRMSREEKVGQMMQLDARDNLDHLINTVHVGSILHTSPDALREAHTLVERTPLGIPSSLVKTASTGIPSLREPRSSPPNWAWQRPGTLHSSNKQPASPRLKHPQPVSTGRSHPSCA